MERESERGISENIIITIPSVDDNVNSYRLQNNYEGNLDNNSNTALMPWIIPRPTLVKPESMNEITVENLLKHGTIYPSNLIIALPSPTNEKMNSSSSSTTSSKSSSKSANSNTLLLTAANLAAFKFDNVTPHHEYVTSNGKNYDTESLASSTHFTLVNGMERKIPKHMKPVECCCERHQLSILITTMTLVFSFTIFLCIYFVQAKAQDDQVRWS
ncbi:uncharacterized protein LOC135836239 [Planococcus citri]|uniref:uncharacterized protein LOC135836239 n=1 Tax=Planococcus citri TaxID=170843 RepID=UPI0031F77499